MGFCIVCNTASKNTGQPRNAKPFQVPVMMLVVPLKADDGTEFEFDCATTFDQTFWDGLINEADASKRPVPIRDVEAFDAPRADNIVEEFPSGRKTLVSEGVRSYAMTLPEVTSQYSGQVAAAGECGTNGVFFVDGCGNIRGNGRVAGKLKPIRISRNTWSSILMWATDTTGQNTGLTFDADTLELDKDLAYITNGSYTADVLASEGLLDVTLANAVCTASDDTIVLDAETIYGDQCDLEGIPGLVLADFTITANALPAVIFSVTEGTNGNYSIALTTDVLVGEVVTVDVTKDGLDVPLISFVAIA